MVNVRLSWMMEILPLHLQWQQRWVLLAHVILLEERFAWCKRQRLCIHAWAARSAWSSDAGRKGVFGIASMISVSSRMIHFCEKCMISKFTGWQCGRGSSVWQAYAAYGLRPLTSNYSLRTTEDDARDRYTWWPKFQAKNFRFCDECPCFVIWRQFFPCLHKVQLPEELEESEEESLQEEDEAAPLFEKCGGNSPPHYWRHWPVSWGNWSRHLRKYETADLHDLMKVLMLRMEPIGWH